MKLKKSITRALVIIFSAGMIITFGLNLALQVFLDIKDFRQTSADHFRQIEQIVEEKEKELEKTKWDFAEDCIIRARAAAYIAQHYPYVITNIEECRLVASLLQVDELHFFTTDGEIYAGTHPEYYGYNFSSGEQMQFFAPLLEDKELELCQGITPNTAEHKLMQYAAVWQKDGKQIVQVGLNPERVLKAIERNNISEIFSMISTETVSTFYAADIESKEIIGSTNRSLVGKNVKDIGLDPNALTEGMEWGRRQINGENCYFAVEQSASLIMIKTCPVKVLHAGIAVDTLLLCVYFVLLFMIILISAYIYIDRRISRNIFYINKKLQEIEGGNWETVLHEDSIEEFAELSRYINSMVGSLLSFSRKISAERDTDQLTGLRNRRSFYEQMEVLFAHPDKLKEVLIVGIDMDQLKMVNDVYGHEGGDRYLKYFAEYLLHYENSGENRLAARIGGDEFEFVAYGLESEAEALAVIDELCSYREDQAVIMENGEKVRLEFSVGWARYPADGAQYMELVRTADRRMYAEKVRRKENDL